MQTQSNYTTRVATTPRLRWGARALAALLVLAVVIVGVLYALGVFGRVSRAATDGTVAAPARPLVTHCRVCQDEVLAARPPRQAGRQPAQATGLIASPARPLLSTCQVCRDEVLGANQSSLIAPAYQEPSLDTSDPHQRSPR